MNIIKHPVPKGTKVFNRMNNQYGVVISVKHSRFDNNKYQYSLKGLDNSSRLDGIDWNLDDSCYSIISLPNDLNIKIEQYLKG